MKDPKPYNPRDWPPALGVLTAAEYQRILKGDYSAWRNDAR